MRLVAPLVSFNSWTTVGRERRPSIILSATGPRIAYCKDCLGANYACRAATGDDGRQRSHVPRHVSLVAVTVICLRNVDTQACRRVVASSCRPDGCLRFEIWRVLRRNDGGGRMGYTSRVVVHSRDSTGRLHSHVVKKCRIPITAKFKASARAWNCSPGNKDDPP